jgi:hypothetical protein
MDLTEKIESMQVKLEAIELSLGVETNDLRLDLSNMQAETISNRQATSERIEAIRREFHTRLEEAKEMAGHTHGTGNDTCAVTLSKFDGTTSWSVLRQQFETVAEHNGWTPKEKSTYLITDLEGRATNVLHGISKGATYEEILQALEDFRRGTFCRSVSQSVETEDTEGRRILARLRYRNPTTCPPRLSCFA